MIYPSLWSVWWWHHLYENNECRKVNNFSALCFRGVCCRGHLSASAEATSFHCLPKIRMQTIPCASIKLRHKRIDDCETGDDETGFYFQLSPEAGYSQVAVSILSCLLGFSNKIRHKMWFYCHKVLFWLFKLWSFGTIVNLKKKKKTVLQFECLANSTLLFIAYFHSIKRVGGLMISPIVSSTVNIKNVLFAKLYKINV